jgi:hypothetical protein
MLLLSVSALITLAFLFLSIQWMKPAIVSDNSLCFETAHQFQYPISDLAILSGSP